MNELETLNATIPPSSGESGAVADPSWVRAGIAALEARLGSKDAVATPEDRAMLITLLTALEEAVRKGTIDAELKRRFAHVGGLVRERVLYSHQPHRTAASLIRIASWGAPKPAQPGQRVHIIARALTGLGVVVSLFLLFEFALTGLFHERAQQDLLAAFKQQVSTTTLDLPSATVAEGSPVALIEIPRIGLKQVIVEGTSPEDLKKGPGHLRAAPMPGEFGNAVVAGRRTTYGAPFKDIDLLRVGDMIRVTTGQGVFAYRVSSVGRVAAGRPDPLLAKLDTRLTLVTSDPAYAPAGRLVAVARMTPLTGSLDENATPLDVAGRAPLAASISELGLAGDPMGLVLGLVFAQLLIAAALLTVRFSRRWPLSLTLMFAVPTLMALAILTFSNVDQLLPGTL